MFKNFFINCDQATTICNKNQYKEATFKEKVKLMYHFISCRVCTLYTKQNVFLSSIYKVHAKDCKEIKHNLTEAEKLEIKKCLENNK